VADDDTTELARALADVTRVTTLVGKMVRLEGGRAIVDVGGGRIPASLFGRIPRPGDDIHIWFMDGKPFVMGPSTLQPFSGVIVTVSGDTATVTTDVGDYPGVPFLGATLSSGDLVGLAWGENGPYVIGKSSLTPDAPPVPPDPTGPVTQRVETFTATGSGSGPTNGSFGNVNDVYASASQIGVYTYGSKVRDALSGNQGIDKGEIYLAAKRDSGNLPLIGTQPLESIGGATPVVSNLSTIGRPFSRWVDITSLMPTLAAGGGIGFDGAGYAVFTGINSDPNQAGALRITYRK
jgi:hypothetical protein